MRACFFDLETTGNDPKTCDIISIGAVCGQESFYVEINPEGDITSASTAIHGFRKSRRGNLLFNESYCDDAVEPEEGLQDFINFLDRLGESVLLVGHYMHKFDSKVLGNQLYQYDIDISSMNGYIDGFADTMNIIRPYYTSGTLKRMSLDAALQHFCGRRQERPHDALEDAKASRDVARAIAQMRKVGLVRLMWNTPIVDAEDRITNYYD